jgi:hypothetical protein
MCLLPGAFALLLIWADPSAQFATGQRLPSRTKVQKIIIVLRLVSGIIFNQRHEYIYWRTQGRSD